MNFLDRFTSIDDLLVSILERIGGVTEEDTHFFSYPNDGTRATITKGTTALDFMGGTVMTPTGVVDGLGNSLRARGREYCRSLSLQADRDIIIQIGTKSKIPVFAGTWFKVAHLRFTDLKIIAAEDTRVFAIACTNPDAIEMVGESYVKDPVDVWGQTATLGNAELAVRTHAPPLTFDRRGDAIRWVDFESDTKNYYATGSAGTTYRRSNYRKLTGDFSFKMSTPAWQHTGIEGYTNDFILGRYGIQTSVAIGSPGKTTISIRIERYTGTKKIRGYLQFDLGSGVVSISLITGGHVIGNFAVEESDFDFSTFKLVVDFESGKYVRAIVFGEEYDISDYDLSTFASTTKRRLRYQLYMSSLITGGTVYVDNIIMTGNEPL